jgi:hypothetical protein
MSTCFGVSAHEQRDQDVYSRDVDEDDHESCDIGKPYRNISYRVLSNQGGDLKVKLTIEEPDIQHQPK